jgi:hypothetical protein
MTNSKKVFVKEMSGVRGQGSEDKGQRTVTNNEYPIYNVQ